MSFEDYEIKWLFQGVRPKCSACELPLKRRKGGFPTFCSIKCGAIGINNPMWGKKGADSPNTGKVRSQEHRENYSKAAHKRYKENPELINQRRKETIARLERGEFNRSGSFVTTNPITDKQERFDSTWEHQFVILHRDNYSDLTKTHKIRIPYTSTLDGREHVYIPDFVSENKKEVVEIKGRFKEKTADKIDAAKEWSKANGYVYRVFTCGSSKTLFEVDVSGMLYGDTGAVPYGGTKMLRWQDRNLSSALVEKMPVEEKEEVAKNVFAFYKENGFPYILHEEQTLKKEWAKLQKETLVPKQEEGFTFLPNKQTAGNKLTQHFNSRQFYTVKDNGRNSKSMIEAFSDDDILLKVIRNRLNITYKETFNIHGAMLRQGFRSTRMAAVTSTFNCLVAKHIYTELTPNDGIVFDFSAGFGHRMLGALASSNNLKYVACDPWTEVVENNKRMAKFIGAKDRAKIWNVGSEVWVPPKALLGTVDLAFSSPPYFDKEVYDNGENGQAYGNRTFEEFISEWWKPTLRTIITLLKPEGKLAINMVEPMIDDLLKVAQEMGFKESHRYHLQMSRSHFEKAKKLGDRAKGSFKAEPIIVLHRR